jgi:hypothetical protein
MMSSILDRYNFNQNHFGETLKNFFFILAAATFPQLTPGQSSFVFKNPGLEYYGAQNQEATFEIVSDLLLNTAKKKIEAADISKDIALINKYILGQMRRTPGNAAASYPKSTLEVLNVQEESENQQRVTFRISGKGVFKTEQKNYTFYVPIQPRKLFDQAKGKCTVESQVESSNFWYHWEPRLPNCPLLPGRDYNIVPAKIHYLPSTSLSFPEYESFQLEDNELRATYLFGMESYTDTNWDANTSGDWGAAWYRQTRDFLTQTLKFEKRTWSDSEIAATFGQAKTADGKNWPTVEDFTLRTKRGKIRFRLFLGVSGLGHESAAFHSILQDSLFNENVVLYSGHSGIGKNIDLNRIEKLRGQAFPLSRNYQIYFWGGCVPYSYYTDLFFARKQNLLDPQGTRKLDIIAYGNESVFTADDDQRFITALVNFMSTGQRTSYQQIIGNQDRFYLGVNGDEDNPTR